MTLSTACPGKHRQNHGCIDFHLANSELVCWPDPGLKPGCNAGHSAGHLPAPGRKRKTPTTDHSVSMPRDCGGACHIFARAALSWIRTPRNIELRGSDGSF